jgi:hypothetical protein
VAKRYQTAKIEPLYEGANIIVLELLLSPSNLENAGRQDNELAEITE